MPSKSTGIDFKKYQRRCQLQGHEDEVLRICICGNTGIATSSRDKTVRFWTLDESEKCKFNLSKILSGHTRLVGPLAWLPPSKGFPEGGIISGGMDTLLLVWNLATGETVQTLKGHKLQVTGIALDGSDVVSSSLDCTLRRWRGDQQVEEWKAHTRAIHSVIKLPSGELVTGSCDMTLKVWKGKSCIHTFHGHTDTVRGVAIVPNLGILSASHDCSIRLWTLDGEHLMKIDGHTSTVYSVDAHASGLVVSGSADGSAKIWIDGVNVQSLEHPGCVWDAKFLGNGGIVTACSDGIVRIWTAVEQDLVASQLSQYKIGSHRLPDAADPIPHANLGMEFLVNRLYGHHKTGYLSYHRLSEDGSTEFDTLLSLAVSDEYDEYSVGGECGGLLYFARRGQTLVCNPTTKELKFLPPSELAADRIDSMAYYMGDGFGYDAASEDFKMIRFFERQYSAGNAVDFVAELYAFKLNKWKRIGYPPPVSCCCSPMVAVHVNGTLYWIASFDDVDDHGKVALLSFDLAKEEFSKLEFLPFQLDPETKGYFQRLHEVDGKLGSFVYRNSRYYSGESIRIWLREGQIWKLRYDIKLGDVLSLLGVHGGLLFIGRKTEGKGGGEFLEGKSESESGTGNWSESSIESGTGGESELESSELQVYDLETRKVAWLDIFGYGCEMQVFPYLRSEYRLPDALDRIPDEAQMPGSPDDEEDPYDD